MVKTWILATSALAIGAFTLIRRWRRRHAETNAVLSDGQAVSSEWLSNARGRRDEDTW